MTRAKMALNTTATLRFEINFTQFDSQNLTKVSNIGVVGGPVSIAEPSGNSSANCIYHTELTLPSGGSLGLNFQSLPLELFGQTVSIALSTLRAIIIRNTETTENSDLIVQASGSDYFTGFFNGSGGSQRVYAKDSFSRSNPIGGWPVTNGSRSIVLKDQGQGVTVDICLIGVSG